MKQQKLEEKYKELFDKAKEQMKAMSDSELAAYIAALELAAHFAREAAKKEQAALEDLISGKLQMP